MEWTDARVQLLQNLWVDGLSASDIAFEIGGITRNAVIGKVYRLGLPVRETAPPKNPRRARKRKSPPPVQSKRVNRIVSAGKHHSQITILDTVQPEAPISKLYPAEIPFEQRKRLLELNASDCRWPYGDPGTPDFFFCGAEAVACRSTAPCTCLRLTRAVQPSPNSIVRMRPAKSPAVTMQTRCMTRTDTVSIRYTPQAIELIRVMAAQGFSRLQVRSRTGWTDSFLASVCRTHAIAITGGMRESVDVLLEHAQIDLTDEERMLVVGVLAAQAGITIVSGAKLNAPFHGTEVRAQDHQRGSPK